jgi:hypothetical protein
MIRFLLSMARPDLSDLGPGKAVPRHHGDDIALPCGPRPRKPAACLPVCRDKTMNKAAPFARRALLPAEQDCRSPEKGLEQGLALRGGLREQSGTCRIVRMDEDIGDCGVVYLHWTADLRQRSLRQGM